MNTTSAIAALAVAATGLAGTGCVTGERYPYRDTSIYSSYGACCTGPVRHSYYTPAYVETVVIDPVLPPPPPRGGSWRRHGRGHNDVRTDIPRRADRGRPAAAEHAARAAAQPPARPDAPSRPAGAAAARPSLPKAEPRSRVQVKIRTKPDASAAAPHSPKSAAKPTPGKPRPSMPRPSKR